MGVAVGFDPFRVGARRRSRPVAAFACGELATGYFLAGFQPAKNEV